MKSYKNERILKIVLLVVIAMVTLCIGYATVSNIDLHISGNAFVNVKQDNFKVKFLYEEGVTPTIEGSSTNTVTVLNDTTASFNVVTLDSAGQSVTATYKVKNESNSVGTQISLSLLNTNNEFFKVTETVADCELQAGDITTVTIRVEMIKTPIEDSVTTNITATLIASPIENDIAIGNDSITKLSDDPISFATDSWATIQNAVYNNNISVYNIGDTKEVLIDVDGDGTKESYTVRIANKTINTNCDNLNYSETACGLVVEFSEVIEKRSMNLTNTNVGGWPATELRSYLNGIFYNKLPNDLKIAIKPTRVISGYSNNGTDSSNFTSNDKIYLLSGTEVNGTDEYDSAANTTSQLEYYSQNSKVKQYNGTDIWWWMRSTFSENNTSFRGVGANGYLGHTYANNIYGVSPAFRIG